MTILNKTCFVCGESKPTTEFYNRRDSKDGLQGYCKSCRAKCSKRNHLKQKYGLSEEVFEAMWVEAASKCAICGDTLTRTGHCCHAVDHNHETGEVRGLLCHGCNKGLGFFKDNPALLKSATAYLEVRGHYGERA